MIKIIYKYKVPGQKEKITTSWSVAKKAVKYPNGDWIPGCKCRKITTSDKGTVVKIRKKNVLIPHKEVECAWLSQELPTIETPKEELSLKAKLFREKYNL